MMKNALRALAGAALLASTTGCYSFALNGQDIAKPVSMTATIGKPTRVVKHFKHEFVCTWYVVGLIPFATFPGGGAPFMTPANQAIKAMLEAELKDGDAITNLKVTEGTTLGAVGLNWGKNVVGSVIPVVGQLLGLVSPVGLIVEGDVVKNGAGRASAAESASAATDAVMAKLQTLR